MGNAIDKLIHAVGFGKEEDYEDEYYEEEYYEEAPRSARPAPQPVETRASERFSQLITPSLPTVSRKTERNAQVNMRIGLIQPLRFEDAQQITKDILDGKIVVFDLSRCELEDAGKIVNFVSGAIFALDGSIQKVNESEAIFVAVPPNVALDNELRAGLGERVEDYSPRIADWVNRTRSRGEF